MARQKQPTPVKRTPSSEVINRSDTSGSSTVQNRRNAQKDLSDRPINGPSNDKVRRAAPHKPPGLTELLVCIGGIYASFLSWAVLQERITTTPYGPSSSPEVFRYPIFLNTVQSIFAALVGYIYLFLTTFSTSGLPPIIPTVNALPSLVLVAVTSSLASPFGYASLKHIDYITFILAKSCKLLPVMALHLTIFRRRYPLYKYAVVALVTAGVAIFTLHHPSVSKKSASKKMEVDRNNSWGLFLLSINLLFDGLTNSTQDYIFQTFQPFSGPQMMCVQNLLNTLLTVGYMFGSPYLAHKGIGRWFGLETALANTEFHEAMAFVKRHRAVQRDILMFAGCGAVGQVFICRSSPALSSPPPGIELKH